MLTPWQHRSWASPTTCGKHFLPSSWPRSTQATSLVSAIGAHCYLSLASHEQPPICLLPSSLAAFFRFSHTLSVHNSRGHSSPHCCLLGFYCSFSSSLELSVNNGHELQELLSSRAPTRENFGWGVWVRPDKGNVWNRKKKNFFTYSSGSWGEP